MRRVPVKLCAALAACMLSAGLVGCAAEGGSHSGDNSMLNETSANSSATQVFEEVSFGAYEQDGNTSNGAEAIEWYVLGEQDGKSLLISKCVLDAVAFDDVDEGVTWGGTSPRPTTDVQWADSSLRAWLNGEFLSTAFSSDEQAAIATVSNADTKNNATHVAANGADPSVHVAAQSEDAVFLLSVAEAKSYLDNNAARVAYPSDYALDRGVYVGVTTDASGQVDETVSGSAVWWLRTSGYYGGYTSVVADDGYVHGAGYRINGELHDGYANHGTMASEHGGNMGVRPWIWVDSASLS